MKSLLRLPLGYQIARLFPFLLGVRQSSSAPFDGRYTGYALLVSGTHLPCPLIHSLPSVLNVSSGFCRWSITWKGGFYSPSQLYGSLVGVPLARLGTVADVVFLMVCTWDCSRGFKPRNSGSSPLLKGFSCPEAESGTFARFLLFTMTTRASSGGETI